MVIELSVIVTSRSFFSTPGNSARTSAEKKEEKGDYYRREMSKGEFSRTVGLPAEVDGAKAKASFKDGLLELTLPKVKKTTKHKIKVE